MPVCKTCSKEIESSSRGRSCPDCHAAYMRDWHYNRNAEVRDLLIAEKIRRGCEWPDGCEFGVSRAIHLSWDHLPGETKTFELGKAQMLRKSVEEVWAEMAKCQVLCHNHHFEMTALRSKNSVALRAEAAQQTTDRKER